MKVEIDQYGAMQISAETPLESYALAHWARDHSVHVTDDVVAFVVQVDWRLRPDHEPSRV